MDYYIGQGFSSFWHPLDLISFAMDGDCVG